MKVSEDMSCCTSTSESNGKQSGYRILKRHGLVFVSRQLAPGVCRAQFVQTEHSHHRGFLHRMSVTVVSKVEHCPPKTYKDESGHVARQPPNEP